MDCEVRPVAEGDWREYRAIRLEMLLDTPSAFTLRLETAQAYTEAEWRERAAYAHRGFVETGHRRPYDLDQTRDEIEMIKRLR